MELSCDICGAKHVKAQILLEGAKLLACSRCMKGGKILHYFREDDSGPLKPMSAKPLPKNAATGLMWKTGYASESASGSPYLLPDPVDLDAMTESGVFQPYVCFYDGTLQP